MTDRQVLTNKSALRGYAEMVDALLARWQPGTELHVTGGGAHNLHEVLRTYRPMVEEIERLTRDMAALQSQWDDMQQGFVEVFEPRWKQLGDGSVWPRTGDMANGDSLEWVLRYAPERLNRGDQLHLASIIAAYRELLSCTDRRRREVIRAMRPTLHSGKQHGDV